MRLSWLQSIHAITKQKERLGFLIMPSTKSTFALLMLKIHGRWKVLASVAYIQLDIVCKVGAVLLGMGKGQARLVKVGILRCYLLPSKAVSFHCYQLSGQSNCSGVNGCFPSAQSHTWSVQKQLQSSPSLMFHL